MSISKTIYETMYQEKENIEYVAEQFASLNTKEDLLGLLNYAKTQVYGDETRPFSLKQLTYYANPKVSKKRYTQFSVKKKSGGNRVINAPVPGLKAILRSLNYLLQCMYNAPQEANGFVIGKSIVDNAKVHLGENYVYNIDLKDFFHSFDRNRVKLGFMRKPFTLNGEREEIAFLLACLCTHPFVIGGSMNIVLPQGSPTSPTITNILCVALDRRLNGLAKRFGAKYTRYADDITFSSNHNIYNNPEFLDELKRIIEKDQQFQINTSKVRLQKVGHRQEVTGLTVNAKVNVNKRYVKTIRMWIYYWEKYGYTKAQQLFERDYSKDKGHVKKGRPNLDNVLHGKLQYLKMVKGDEDSTFKSLNERYLNLVAKGGFIDAVLNQWENSGVDSAMKLYFDENAD